MAFFRHLESSMNLLCIRNFFHIFPPSIPDPRKQNHQSSSPQQATLTYIRNQTIWDTLVCVIGFPLAQQNLLTQPHSPRLPLALRPHQRALHPLRSPILHLWHPPPLAKQPKAPLLPHRLPPPLGCRSLRCRLRPARIRRVGPPLPLHLHL